MKVGVWIHQPSYTRYSRFHQVDMIHSICLCRRGDTRVFFLGVLEIPKEQRKWKLRLHTCCLFYTLLTPDQVGCMTPRNQYVNIVFLRFTISILPAMLPPDSSTSTVNNMFKLLNRDCYHKHLCIFYSHIIRTIWKKLEVYVQNELPLLFVGNVFYYELLICISLLLSRSSLISFTFFR